MPTTNDRITKYSVSFSSMTRSMCGCVVYGIYCAVADGKEPMSNIQMNDARDVLCAFEIKFCALFDEMAYYYFI